MKFIKELMKSLPVKSLVLLPVFFMFVLTLGGCASSTSIEIRNLHDAPDAVWDAIEACPNNACMQTQIETLPAITDNTVPLMVESEDWAMGYFHATFNTGRPAVGAITWSLTINNVPVTVDTPNVYFDVEALGVYIVFNGFPTQEVRLTASADGASSRSIVLTAPPASEGGGSTPDEPERGSQRH